MYCFFFTFNKLKPSVKLSFYDVNLKKKSLTLLFTFAVVLLKKKQFAICRPIATICFQQSPAEQIVDTMSECILYNETNVV